MRKLKNILVPVDFTPHADNALRYARALAEHLQNARLLVLHSFSVPAAVTGAGAMALAPYYDEELRNSTDEKLSRLEASLLQDCQVPYELISEYGPAVPDICEIADRNNVDLIVLPAHPTNRLDEYLGNVTTATIRSSQIPVLVVPSEASFSPPETLVFATDCKQHQVQPLEQLNPWLQHFKPKVSLVYVGMELNHLPEEKALNLLSIRDFFSAYFPRIETIEQKEVEEGILRYTSLTPNCLLAIMPRKHDPIYHLLNKSITHRLAFHTTVPMLVLV